MSTNFGLIHISWPTLGHPSTNCGLIITDRVSIKHWDVGRVLTVMIKLESGKLQFFENIMLTSRYIKSVHKKNSVNL